MEIKLIEEKQSSIYVEDINVYHIVIAIIDKNPFILNHSNDGYAFFPIYNIINNNKIYYFETISDVIRNVVRNIEDLKIGCFKDKKEAYLWLYENL